MIQGIISVYFYNKNSSKNKLNLASTYLNKGAIQSQMNKHDKALESLNKAVEFLR